MQGSMCSSCIRLDAVRPANNVFIAQPAVADAIFFILAKTSLKPSSEEAPATPTIRDRRAAAEEAQLAGKKLCSVASGPPFAHQREHRLLEQHPP